MQLRPFQVKAFDAYRKTYNDHAAHLGIAATAFGKTIFAATLAARMIPKTRHRFVMLAHREALIEQNAAKVEKVDNALKVGREIADQVADPSSDFISASVATLRGKRLETRAAEWRADGRPIFLIIDEAHHATAKSYQNVIQSLKPDRMLGLTATPVRPDDPGGEGLRAIFPGLAFQIDRGPLIDDGWLAKPLHWSIQTSTSLAGIRTNSSGDYNEKELEHFLNVMPRNDIIVNVAKDIREILHEAGRKVSGVAFCISVEHAEQLQSLLTREGFKSKAISAETPIEERRAWDEALRRGDADTIVTSMGVHVEGWDVEQINLALFTRPTKSQVLADQMLGRALRKDGDNAAYVVDFEDAGSDNRVSVASTFGLPKAWCSGGENIREDELWFKEQLKAVPWSALGRVWRTRTRQEVAKILKDLAQGVNADPQIIPDRGFMWWDCGPELRLICGYGSIVISATPYGDYEASWRFCRTFEIIARTRRVQDALDHAESWLETFQPERSDYCRIRSDDGTAATDKQLTALKRFGVVADGLTKYQARLLLGMRFVETAKLLEQGRIAFSKHRGTPVDLLPSYFLEWAINPENGFVRARPEYEMLVAEAKARNII